MGSTRWELVEDAGKLNMSKTTKPETKSGHSRMIRSESMQMGEPKNIFFIFFRKRYAERKVVHVSSNIPMAGYLFRFWGDKLPLFSVFRCREKEINRFGGTIPLFHTGGEHCFNSTMVKHV